MSITTGTAQRFGDGLSLGLKRYEDSDKNALWRIYVAKYIGDNARIEQDAKIKELTEMKIFIERAIEIVRTDGGRKP